MEVTEDSSVVWGLCRGGTEARTWTRMPSGLPPFVELCSWGWHLPSALHMKDSKHEHVSIDTLLESISTSSTAVMELENGKLCARRQRVGMTRAGGTRLIRGA